MKEDVFMRKMIFCITLFLLLICFGYISTYAASESDLTYTINDNQAIITDCKTSSIGELVIPNTFAGCPVTSIGGYAFEDCNNLVSVTIPDSVTNIGSHAFDGCGGLISIRMPNSLTNMGAGAFVSCSSLANITIPNGVTSIGYATFWGCSSLESITIPDGVTNIGKNAFMSCSSLISINIPSSVTDIVDHAFYGCSSLESIKISNGVTSIGELAFYCCSSLKNVYITDLEAWCNIDFANSDSNPLYYGGELYLNGNLLTEITIPDSVTSIGNYAFWGCNSVKSITIPDSVTSIGDLAFYGCSNLTKLTVGKGIEVVSEGAFKKSDKLEYIVLPAETKYIRNDAFNDCNNIDAVFYAGNQTQWESILKYNGNENLIDANIVYNSSKKTYKFESNCDTKLSDINDYAIFTMPVIENDEKTLTGWYDNEELTGNPVTFPYYGDATTLYAAWTDRTGKTFDDAFIAKANQEYTVSTTENGQYVYFEFVPNHSKEYRFYSTGGKDTCGYLYNSNKLQLTSDDDDGDGDNFYISYNLTAGQTYYVATKIYSGTGTFAFVVEEPMDYRINSVTIKDMSGNELSAIPTGTFLATVSFTNVSSSADTVIILAQYTDAGAFKGLMYIQTEDVPTGSTIKLSIPVDNSNGDVAKLKAFCWESVGSLTPMGNSASFPVE